MLYNAQMLEQMGEVYHKLLWIKDKKNGRDPYVQISDIFPYKCFVMVLPTVVSIGIPEHLNAEIAELMNKIDVADSEKLMDTPVPLELRMCWHKGFSKIYTASLV